MLCADGIVVATSAARHNVTLTTFALFIGLFPFLVLDLIDSFLAPISRHSSVPSENSAPCYKENGGQRCSLTADYADILSRNCRGCGVDWLFCAPGRGPLQVQLP